MAAGSIEARRRHLQPEIGVDRPLHDPDSVIVFEDHTSYVEQSPAHLKAGLVPNMQAMVRAQREFAARHGLRTHRTLTDEEAAQDDGSNVAGISPAFASCSTRASNRRANDASRYTSRRAPSSMARP